MGIHVIRRASELGDALVLAPERFDPRRTLEMKSTRCLADVAEIVTENVTERTLSTERRLLILDTTHAYEGFVVLRHHPVVSEEMRSAKRRILPGDVIISRLRPYLRQVAYVDAALFELESGGNDVVASTEFFVLRGKDGFDSSALVPFLLSDSVQSALAAGQEGGHHPRFSKQLLSSLPIPDCIVEEDQATSKRVRELAAGIRRSLTGCRILVSEVQEQIS